MSNVCPGCHGAVLAESTPLVEHLVTAAVPSGLRLDGDGTAGGPLRSSKRFWSCGRLMATSQGNRIRVDFIFASRAHDDAEMEQRADEYATILMTGGADVPDVRASGFRELALKAAAVEKEDDIDASAVVWAWARRTGNYAMATMASQALYRTKGGKRTLRESITRNLRFDDASDSDRALLRCLAGDPERDTPAS
jgi:hypothetical protein